MTNHGTAMETRSGPGRRRELRRCRCDLLARAGLITGLLLAPAALAAQTSSEPPAATIRETVEVTAVTVAVRIEGGGKRGGEPLGASDLVVREDGEIRRIVSLVRLAAVSGAAPSASVPLAPAPVEPLLPAEARPTRIAIYVDVPMTSSRPLAAALGRLADQAEKLVAAGQVEVVVADPDPRRVVEPTRDAQALAASLRSLIGRGPALSAVERIRLPLLRGDEDFGGHRDLIAQRAQEEARYIDSRRTLLAVWAASTPSFGRPRILYIVSGGYDSDPRDFYLERLRNVGGGAGSGGGIVRGLPSDRELLETDLQRLAQAGSEEALGGDLATLGWLVFPVAFADVGFETFGGAEESGNSRWTAMGRGSAYGTTGAQPFLFTHPLAGWTTFSAPTGGTTLGSERDLARSLRGLGDLGLLTYERTGPLTGATHRLEVEVRRTGFAVHAPARVSEGTPESAAAVATIRRLAGGPAEVDLPVGLAIAASRESVAGRELTVAVTVETGQLAAAVGPAFGKAVRLTLAAPDGEGSAAVIQRVAAAPAGAGQAWRFEISARVPRGTREVAVRVEDLGSGLAGSAVLDLGVSPAGP